MSEPDPASQPVPQPEASNPSPGHSRPMPDPHPARQCLDIDWSDWEPYEQATLLFIMEEQKVLLIHKLTGLGKGKINGPGGRLEAGETPLQAAVREVEEELLVTPIAPEARGRLRFQFTGGYSLECFVFSSTEYTGVPTETHEARPEWFAQVALPLERMWADDKYWLPQMVDGAAWFEGEFIFDDDTMLDHQLAFDGA